ncbi:hypothetical protein ACHAQH_003279 [Verticillium albo-atrum]
MAGDKKKGQPSNAGIITDTGGERFIPESQRADGSTRKAIKIRPGFRPTEDVEIFKSRAAEARAARGVPGTVGLSDDKADISAASTKNSKRREARKKAKAGVDDREQGATEMNSEELSKEAVEEVDPEVERAKKARALKKKLRQAKELQNKKEGGEALLPEQIAKVIKINELVRELEALGFDADGEPKNGASTTSEKDEDNTKG